MSGIRRLPTAPTETRELTPGDEVTPHHHDDHQLIYASAGVLEVFVPQGTWFTPSVRAVWVPAGTVHRWQVHGATTVRMVGVPTSLRPSAERVPALVAVDALLRELIIACSEQGPADTPAARRWPGSSWTGWNPRHRHRRSSPPCAIRGCRTPNACWRRT